MRIHCFQHVSFETPGTILEWINAHEHTISYTRFYEVEQVIPGMDSFDALLIMGGYMNVDEEEQFPWLRMEKTFIREAINAGKKVLGICLGSQLIASAMGAKVYKGPEKEIGFIPLQFSEAVLQHRFFDHYPADYTLFHWHGDTFDLPAGALLLASTVVCPHQAFMIGDHVLALQFHPEMNEVSIEQMILHDGHELQETGNYIQSAGMIREGYGVLEQNKKDLFLLLDKFFSKA
jgi:GMP synthase-like glutamine amidotransferase